MRPLVVIGSAENKKLSNTEEVQLRLFVCVCGVFI